MSSTLWWPVFRILIPSLICHIESSKKVLQGKIPTMSLLRTPKNMLNNELI